MQTGPQIFFKTFGGNNDQTGLFPNKFGGVGVVVEIMDFLHV